MRRRRHCITLLEVVISLGLLSLLLSSLFFWYYHLSMRKEEIAKKKWPILEVRYADQRLQKLFTHLEISPSTFFTTDDMGTTSLVFCMDNGPHPEPALSHTVLARLYHDAYRQALCLAIWPPPSEKKDYPSETVILLDQVSKLDFEFYHPPSEIKPVDPEEVGHLHPRTGRQSLWYKTYNSCPTMFKIQVHRNEEDVVFAFDLSKTEKDLIRYPAGKV